MSFLNKLFGNAQTKELKSITALMQTVVALEDKYKSFSESDLKNQTNVLKERLSNGESLDDILADAFAVCREASTRVLGMTHYPVQIIGGIALHRSNIAEMKTGEGKTLVATLPVYLNALSGNGVHVITVNDYLATRDSQWMGKLYEYLGLTVGLCVHGMNPSEKKAAYAADITYGTNNEFGFDYLRDNMVIYKDNMVQRGFNFAIVDEVDSILIDEARTPLIISGQGDKSTDLYKIANTFARTLSAFRVAEHDSKEDLDDKTEDVIIDEKAKQATLTKHGIKKAEEFFNLENYSDADNMTIAHHITQAIKANNIMKRDVDYVVREDEVVIVDEFTGRLMQGRRYNEGLHQAIEAKENVKIAHESKTLASITFQNYFRMYKKLAGMTGTALSEADEFLEIYGLAVLEIPTNKPIARQDLNDMVFKTERAKFNAVVEDAVIAHEKGQPVLIGTVSIEKSEEIGQLLKKRGVRHEILNAKHHEREAEIVAQAGKKGAVTIATNMAGRGTDIILGGNPEFMAKSELRKKGYTEEMIENATSYFETDDAEIINQREEFQNLDKKYKDMLSSDAKEVKDAGGLVILGTERHESRRIDNQLRGRAGRQGDPGMSKFFISFEDDLMRLFANTPASSLITSSVPDDMPIEHKMLTNTIETAQKRIEGRNFDVRKNVLKYDEVMNSQRQIIYKQRGDVLSGGDVSNEVKSMVSQSITDNVNLFCSEENASLWNIQSLKDTYRGWLITDEELVYSDEELNTLTKDDLSNYLIEKATKILTAKEELLGDEKMREFERVALLRNVDKKWMEHIDAMDQLRRGIGLRGYGSRDPVSEYRMEGFDMFDEMIESIRQDTTKMLIAAQIRVNNPIKREEVAKVTGTSGGSESAPVRKAPDRVTKVGRNDPCPCGSGKKYKQCHGKPGAEKL